MRDSKKSGAGGRPRVRRLASLAILLSMAVLGLQSFVGPALAGDGSTQLSLPWATDETWTLTGGPHPHVLNGGRPWTSLDFAGGSGTVRAARAGVVSVRECGVRVDHGGGVATDYYHLAIAVADGQSVERGQELGQISTCDATAAHVHFTIFIDGAAIAINGVDIGGWTVEEGAEEYQGCMRRISDGTTACAGGGQVYNDGTVGSGGQSPPPSPSPSPSSSPSPSPSPSTTPSPSPLPSASAPAAPSAPAVPSAPAIPSAPAVPPLPAVPAVCIHVAGSGGIQVSFSLTYPPVNVAVTPQGVVLETGQGCPP